MIVCYSLSVHKLSNKLYHRYAHIGKNSIFGLSSTALSGIHVGLKTYPSKIREKSTLVYKNGSDMLLNLKCNIWTNTSSMTSFKCIQNPLKI